MARRTRKRTRARKRARARIITIIAIAAVACMLPFFSVKAVTSKSSSGKVNQASIAAVKAVKKIQLLPITNIEGPTLSKYSKGINLKVVGWAINPSGVKEVKVYVNSILCGKANYGSIRNDVKKVYPSYINSDKSGFSYIINSSKLTVGNNTIKVVTVGNNGSIKETNKIIEVYAYIDRMNMDASSSKVSGQQVNVWGWAINISKIKQVNMYLNNKLLGKAVYGSARSDVNKAFPGYPSGNYSGFSYTIPLKNITPGSYVLIAEAVGINGTKKTISKKILVQKKKPLGSIESPVQTNLTNMTTVDVKGWGLNAEGVKWVNVYVDNKLTGKAQYGLTRNDVNKLYPGYINGAKSGFQYKLNTNGVTVGKHLLRIEIIGNDNSSQIISKQLDIYSLEPRVSLNNILSLTVDKNLVIGGYALNKSGMNQVKVYIDGIYKGKANYGLNRPDVNSAYYGYPKGDKSGYSFSSSISSLSNGKHTVKIIAAGNDSSNISVEKSFSVLKLTPIVAINADFKDYDNLTGKKELSLCGWALNDAKVKQVDIYLDGKFKASILTNVLRSDVKATYPNYPYSLNSGFAYKLSIDNIGVGTHIIEAYARGYDNTTASTSIHFKTQVTIVIDAGHNYGGDDGAYSTIGGTTYVERNLNMQLAIKVKDDLVQYGFNVIMTRNQNDVSKEDAITSLKERVDIANNAKADLFLSIHHDVSPSSATSGISAHYSTYRPNLDNSGIIVKNDIYYDTTPTEAAVKSASLAQQLLNSLATLGYNNRGKSDHNLYVTQNTIMPSVLLECGFITNLKEAVKSALNSEQNAFASKMAAVVYNFFH